MQITFKRIDVLNPPTDNENVGMCVTTNGVVKRDGSAVMGAGIAKQAVSQYGSGIAAMLGRHIREHGNHACNLGEVITKHGSSANLISFPTKNHWKDDSNLGLIAQSITELVHIADELDLDHVYLPAVGCGCGNLDINQVLDLCCAGLDDRFIMVIPRNMRGSITAAAAHPLLAQ